MDKAPKRLVAAPPEPPPTFPASPEAAEIQSLTLAIVRLAAERDHARRDLKTQRDEIVTLCFDAGCICHDLIRGGRAVFRSSGHYQSVVQEHDPRCPRALAKVIQNLGE